MKYLVLGSAGQIGSHLVTYLKNQGHDVLDFDIVTNPTQDLKAMNPAFEFIKNADFIFFLAFDVGGAKYLETYQNTFGFIDNNIRIMENTFRCLHDLNKPFIFTSSQMSSLSFSCYGSLKHIGEYYCRSLNSPIVRFWNIYGIEKKSEKSHVITDFVKMAIKGGPITMRTSGKEERQFLHSDDCSKALYEISKKYYSLSRKEEYHVTSFKWVKVKTIAEIISQQCGGVKIVNGCIPDNTHNSCRTTPSPYILNYWKPETTLENGISHIINHEKEMLNVK